MESSAITITSPPKTTTDRYNTALSLNLLRLYATPATVTQVYLLRQYGKPVPTYAAFVDALTALRN
jgi:hypothetical protein